VAPNGTSTLAVTTSSTMTTGTYTITISGSGGGLGRSTAVTLTVSAAAAGQSVQSYTSSQARTIPDNYPSGIASPISVADSQTIASVSVSVNIIHAAQGDLAVSLVAPNGVQCRLHNRTGGTTDNLVTTFSIITTPVDSLASLNGLNAAGTWYLKVQDLAATQTGTLNSWRLTFNGEKTATPNAAIPNYSTTGVSSVLNFPFTGTVTSARVRVRILHPYRGDLVVTLIAPDGTQVILHNRSGSSADNIDTEYPDLTVPAQSLSTLTGRNISGNWALKVQDLAPYNTGTFVSWSLSLNS
jgi:subtilisin-like proprotein convertase family protein